MYLILRCGAHQILIWFVALEQRVGFIVAILSPSPGLTPFPGFNDSFHLEDRILALLGISQRCSETHALFAEEGHIYFSLLRRFGYSYARWSFLQGSNFLPWLHNLFHTKLIQALGKDWSDRTLDPLGPWSPILLRLGVSGMTDFVFSFLWKGGERRVGCVHLSLDSIHD